MVLNMRPSGLILEKKRILPWYDTSPVYVCLGLFSLAAVIFSLAGITVALDTPGYNQYVWAPYLLLVLSAVLLLFSGLRLIFRLFEKLREGN